MTPRPGEPQQGWWARNWVWAVPGGCIGCLGLMVGSCVLFVGGLFSAVRTSEDFQRVLAQIQADPDVIAALGEPIEAGFLFQGNVEINDDRKIVDIKVPISGPEGSATLIVEGEEVGGVWQFERLEVELESGDRIDLLDKESSTVPPPEARGPRRDADAPLAAMHPLPVS